MDRQTDGTASVVEKLTFGKSGCLVKDIYQFLLPSCIFSVHLTLFQREGLKTKAKQHEPYIQPELDLRSWPAGSVALQKWFRLSQHCILIWFVKLRWDIACEVPLIAQRSSISSRQVESLPGACRETIPRCLLATWSGCVSIRLLKRQPRLTVEGPQWG